MLRVKYNLSQLKLYVEEKTVDTGGDTTEFTVAVGNEKPSTSVNTGICTPLVCNEINYWDFLKNELVKKLLLWTIKESGPQTCQTYQNVIQRCKRLVYLTLLFLRSLSGCFLNSSYGGFLDPSLVTARVLFRMCCCIRPTCFVI